MSVERERLAEDFLSFAQLAPRAHSELELRDALMARLAPFGVTHVLAGVSADSNRSFKFGPSFGRVNIAWMQTWVGRKLYRDDPVFNHSISAQRANYWDRCYDPLRLTPKQLRVLGVARELGAADGFMTPLPLFNGDVVIVSFQGERIDRHPDVEAAMRGLALYYGVDGHRLVTRARNANALKGMTRRQLEVLHLAALGRRDHEIAEELGISVHTVDFHLRGARARLSASNTKEAVALLHAAPVNAFDPYGSS